MRARLAAYAAGVAFIALGVWGIVIGSDTNPPGWAVWFAGAVVAHDGVLAPCVLLVGALTTRLPASYRRRVQHTLLVAGAVSLMALPFVLGYGRRADNPSILPLPYGRNLLVVLAAIAVIALLWGLSRKRSDEPD
ncbi:hypothetical protein Acsp03_69860 [Actinomadura sp. NBRC 104412]|uniref:hypothetical protein n=1 Tax=Actinomadura sp. NBRC 104412 TaxID=3032203 RepID=UPI00249FB0CE|nr:hypothetical protein [Actinomadura sp. NBRC 104412]GLZ09520.1 hypothetical protein Acsp03_69860 [Actinomadura sp. NBRC 104412]